MPPPPPLVATLLGSSLPLVRSYVEWLAGPGIDRGLLGPRERPRLWERHILNSAILQPYVPVDSAVCDLGSGAGLPGVVLAVMRPDLTVTLLEPLARRVRFLDEVVAALALPNVRVVRARAQDHHPAPGYDVVVARAVAPLDRLVTWALPLLRPGGCLLALKGASVAEETTRAAPTLRRLAARADVLDLGGTRPEDATWMVRITADAAH